MGLSNIASKLGGGGHHGGGSANNEDYIDRGLDSVEKKYGGGHINPQDTKARQTNEKITDAGRNKFESMTGKKVPHKVSN
ncbi:hypothetical protein BDV29DRAFT_168416 [Aspergillus leporis]|uniref:Uncharacterized protein n=1 Tax=Aspergillus leporis TaxID=41062 RepID=A0A5N5XCN5_9EURO|nr:hypothetical protein BDV29DRAFT_168416 [Aspergillus leporis]